MSEDEHTPAPASSNGGKILLAILWPSLGLLAVIVAASIGLVVLVAVIKGADESVAQLLGQARAISRLVALVLVVPAIVCLTLLDKVPGAAAVAALSAIAGYVLGGVAAGP